MSERDVNRRESIQLLATAGVAIAAGCARGEEVSVKSDVPAIDPVQAVLPLGFPWQTRDPFLFCVHHDDHYPEGNERFGPAASLAGRRMGMDFEGKDGWRMYHGDVVPGFPQHPHRGFETVTVVRQGLLDHADSMGAAARYGGGDVQWLTAGRGILHAEMFPLLAQDQKNPVELFQLWLNLPSQRKMVDPYFSMLWAPTIPRLATTDAAGKAVEVVCVAGALGELAPPSPPPDSWAADPATDVAIWTIKLAPGARWTLPPSRAGVNRSLYVFRGGSVSVGPRSVTTGHRVDVTPDVPVELVAGSAEVELLMLQGRPIGEPVAQHGPFVMNTRAEIQQAFQDYQRTRFGGWPWDRDDPVHGRQARFARHADGKVEQPA
ncbi:MAG: pirin family protein [Myxococcales bacterium]|nr:pirin family protein [Myxococcales bacterium]